MTPVEPAARVSLVIGGRSGACEACTSAASSPTTTLLVQQAHGGTVELVVCDWCVQAFRRLAAVSGGHIAFNLAEAAAPPAAIVRGTGRAASPPGPAILITELAEQLLDGAGTAYVVRIF